jgi:hypothetical protein
MWVPDGLQIGNKWRAGLTHTFRLTLDRCGGTGFRV